MDWVPTTQGIQWIEVELEDGQTSKGPTVDVRQARDQGFIENLFGNVNPVIGSLVALIFVSIIVTGLIWARKATRGRGSNSEYDWDEYSSEIDYGNENDDHEDEENSELSQGHTAGPAASITGASLTLTSTTNTGSLWKQITGLSVQMVVGGIMTKLQMHGITKMITAILVNLTNCGEFFVQNYWFATD